MACKTPQCRQSRLKPFFKSQRGQIRMVALAGHPTMEEGLEHPPCKGCKMDMSPENRKRRLADLEQWYFEQI